MAELLTVKVEMEDVAERVMDKVTYKGKTIREWADLLTNPKTNGDRLRAMSDEELAFYMQHHPRWIDADEYLDWLQSPADGGDGDE